MEHSGPSRCHSHAGACLPGQTQRLYLLVALLQAQAEPSTSVI